MKSLPQMQKEMRHRQAVAKTDAVKAMYKKVQRMTKEVVETETTDMTSADALLFVERLRLLSVRDSAFCKALAKNLSPAQQSAMRCTLREAGEAWSVDYALDPRERTKS